MTDYLTFPPSEFMAGDLIQWAQAAPNGYGPSDGGTMSVVLANADGKTTFDGITAATGTSYLVTLSSADTSSITEGVYTMYLFATVGAERVLIDKRPVTVMPDVTTASAHDGRSWAAKVLEAIEATIAGKATVDQLTLSVNGRSLGRYSFTDLLTARATFKRIVEREEMDRKLAAGEDTGAVIHTRFVS